MNAEAYRHLGIKVAQAMSVTAGIKKLMPLALKRPLRNFADNLALHQQVDLPFDTTNLRHVSGIDIAAIMKDRAISNNFSEDHQVIGRTYGCEEIFGGVNPGDRRAIYHLIAHFRPRRVLEIGTHVAASTIYIAGALRRFVPGGKLTTADILDVNGPLAAWSSVGMSAPPAQYVAQLGLQNITEFVKSPASEALASRERFDLIFLDGDHSRQAVYREISSALAVLNPEGLILLHDFYPGGKPLTPDGDAIAGPSSAALRISQEVKDIAFIPLGDLPWPTKAGGNATSLALVAKQG